MKRNYSKLISVTLILVLVLTAFAFPTPVYAGDKPPVGEQTGFAVFENNGGAVGDQIGSDSSPVIVSTGQNVFVCIHQSFSQALEKHSMGGQWRTWGGDWQSMAVIGAGSSTAWEYWNSNYTDHAIDAIDPHFAGSLGTYVFESDFPGYSGKYPPNKEAIWETWFVIQAPDDNATQYEIRWYDSSDGVGLTPTVRVDVRTPPDVTNLPTEYGFGLVGENSTATTPVVTTGPSYFQITNSSAYAIDIAIKGTDMANGTKTWVLADNGSPGTDIYALYAGLENGSYDIIVRKTETYNTLKSGLAALGTQRWGLEIYMPTTINSPEQCTDMNATVTLICTAS